MAAAPMQPQHGASLAALQPAGQLHGAAQLADELDSTEKVKSRWTRSFFTGLNTRNDEERDICDICHKDFASPSNLFLHRSTHAIERRYKCEPCQVSFHSQGHLQKHKRSSAHETRVEMTQAFGIPTSDNPRPYGCPECNTAFRKHGHLAKHLRSKSHITKLEANELIPVGTYAALEKSGQELKDKLVTANCEQSLISLRKIAMQLFQGQQSDGGGGGGGGGCEGITLAPSPTEHHQRLMSPNSSMQQQQQHHQQQQQQQQHHLQQQQQFRHNALLNNTSPPSSSSAGLDLAPRLSGDEQAAAAVAARVSSMMLPMISQHQQYQAQSLDYTLPMQLGVQQQQQQQQRPLMAPMSMIDNLGRPLPPARHQQQQQQQQQLGHANHHLQAPPAPSHRPFKVEFASASSPTGANFIAAPAAPASSQHHSVVLGSHSPSSAASAKMLVASPPPTQPPAVQQAPLDISQRRHAPAFLPDHALAPQHLQQAQQQQFHQNHHHHNPATTLQQQQAHYAAAPIATGGGGTLLAYHQASNSLAYAQAPAAFKLLSPQQQYNGNQTTSAMHQPDTL